MAVKQRRQTRRGDSSTELIGKPTRKIPSPLQPPPWRAGESKILHAEAATRRQPSQAGIPEADRETPHHPLLPLHPSSTLTTRRRTKLQHSNPPQDGLIQANTFRSAPPQRHPPRTSVEQELLPAIVAAREQPSQVQGRGRRHDAILHIGKHTKTTSPTRSTTIYNSVAVPWPPPDGSAASEGVRKARSPWGDSQRG